MAGFDDKGGNYPISIKSKSGDEIRAKHVVTCAGLHSDRVAAKSGGEELPKIVPFRGDYLLLKPDKAHWINGTKLVFISYIYNGYFLIFSNGPYKVYKVNFL